MEQIQQDVAQKLLVAELDTLEREGNLHPGFSSLYGRLNGIWRNKELLGKAAETVQDLNGLDD